MKTHQRLASLLFFSLLVGWKPLLAGSTPPDSALHIEEVTIQQNRSQDIRSDVKMGGSVEELLGSSDKISFIKRGAYAWEPMLHNLSSERSLITIDGMHVFGACTDKMDPVTTYVERNQLASVQIRSGQKGNQQGATVGGSVDLQRIRTPFARERKWTGTYQTGFESNNRQLFNLANASYSEERWIAEASIARRTARNYHSGGTTKNAATEVLHSQFEKFNASLGIGYKTGLHASLRAEALFDRAWNTGFPALPMDLWLSRGLISSVTYLQAFPQSALQSWESKLYYHAMEHYMDDTKRAENLVHMDMPGWSTTYGAFSKAYLQHGRVSTAIHLNAHQNLSIAEMTMYPQDRSNKAMFAYSWPWVTSRFAGLSIQNNWFASDRTEVTFGGSLGWNQHHARYIEFNRIFYPDAPQTQQRWLPGAHAGIHLHLHPIHFEAGLGVGQRAPSVSEAYGYYIYNSFDRYDYVGNPHLPNEQAWEAHAQGTYKNDVFHVEARIHYFHIQHYIVGRVLHVGSPMNYQSVGVKGYESLPDAHLLDMALHVRGQLSEQLNWRTRLTYTRARDGEGANLPFIRPLSYEVQLINRFERLPLQVQVSLQGDDSQRHFSPAYGEDRAPAYQTWDVSADYSLRINPVRTTLQLGVENLLNTRYSTYADWGNLPRMGRNLYLTVSINY